MNTTIKILILFCLPALLYSKNHPITQGISVRESFVKDNSRVNWCVIHDNENDAAAVLHWALKEYGGYGFEVLNSRQSNKRIHKAVYNKLEIYYDPNRIFTDEGIYKTIYQYNRKPKKVIKTAQRILSETIRPALLKILRFESSHYLIALHNNYKTGDVSILDFYRKKGFFIFREPGESIKNFALVTRKKDFDTLSKKGINVVWQFEINPDNNDGSLSVYSLRHNLPYVNIESVFGDIESQKKIIRVIVEQLLK